VEKYSERRDSMTSVWVDLETTGIEPIDSGAFEIALLVYRGAEKMDEVLYNLNPLDDEVKFHEEAFKVNGISEEMIRGYPPAEKVLPEIAEFLEKYKPEEGLVFAGYNCKFDYGHLSALFFRHGICMEDYFNRNLIDVYTLVQKAAAMGILPKTIDQKLGTMTKALGIEHGKVHTALDDIKATRRLYEEIYRIERERRR
jgi:DNA polymerase III epsilon subunit-like protein